MIWGSISKTINIFWNILGFTYDYSIYVKTIVGIFVYLLISRVKTRKKKIIFTSSAVKMQHVLFANEPFLRKILVFFFSSNIPLYTEKYPVGKLCKVLKM